jgi:hypothetical protein
MKNSFYVLVFSLFLVSCQSDDNGSKVNLINSTIKVDGIAFVPNEIKVENGTPNFSGEGSLVFTMKNTSENEQLIVKIDYPLTSSSAPNGVYDFGIGVIGTMLFAQGNYSKGINYYSLAGYTVQVTSLGNNKFKLEFQNVQAVSINTNTISIITGYCEGNF